MKKLVLLMFLFAAPAFAQTDAFNGYCTLGASKAVVSGLSSSNIQQGIIPKCTVTVYFTGTTTKATIFTNAASGVLTNPFTASVSGQWLFYAANGVGYDVVMNGGTPPNAYGQGTNPVAVALTDLKVSAGGGGTSTCGPLAGDSTSTNCGNNNFVGTPVVQGETIVQAYGFTNVNSSPFLNNSVASGSNNLSNDVGTSLPSSVSAAVGVGIGNINFINSGGSITGIGQANAQGVSPGGSNNVFEIFAGGDSSAFLIGNNVNDVVAIGDHTANTIPTGSKNIIAVGDGADGQCDTFAGCNGGLPNPVAVHDVIAVGARALTFNQGSDVTAVGHSALGQAAQFFNTGAFNSAFGSYALVTNSTGQHNTAMGGFAGADGYVELPLAIGNSNHTGSDNSWFGFDSGPFTTTQLSNTNAFGSGAHNTASNQTVIGNSSITSLILFGCPTGQSVLDDGSGTCYVPGSGGSGGTSVGVNGGSALASANLNGTTPAAGANNINASWQVSGTNVSAEVPFATGSAFGVIKPDGTSCTVTAGVLTCPGTGGAITLANVGAGASPTGLFDFSAATHLKLPSRAGYTAAASGEIGYDTTNLNIHFNVANTDLLAVGFPSASGLPVNGHCMQWTIIGAWLEATDAGAPCGSGSGGAVSSVSNSDGTLTISPTTGGVVASLNLAHANTWTAPIAVNDGTGKAGNIGLTAGTAPSAAPANTVQINAPTAVMAYSMNLPPAQGTGALTNDGAGNLSFVPSGAGSVTAVTGTAPIVSSGGTAPAISCPTCGVTGSPLSQFAATTSLQLRGVVSDESGTGALLFAGGAFGTPTSVTLTNATGLPTTGLTGALQAAQEPAHTGDATNTAGSLAMAVVKVNGGSVPTSASFVGTNSSSQIVAATLPIYLNWTFNSGAAATDASPRFLASRTGTIANCFALTTSSDGATALTFNIFRNGTTIFSGGAQTIAAGTAAGTLTTLGALGTTAITNNDKISFNITSGTSSWVFTVSCK